MKVPRAKRFRVPPGPKKPGFSPMAARTREVLHIVAQGSTVPRRRGTVEHIAVHVVLSDGAVYTGTASMHYTTGEREGIVERALGGTATAADLRRVMAIRAERWRKQEQLYGDLHRRYGKGIPA